MIIVEILLSMNRLKKKQIVHFNLPYLFIIRKTKSAVLFDNLYSFTNIIIIFSLQSFFKRFSVLVP